MPVLPEPRLHAKISFNTLHEEYLLTLRHCGHTVEVVDMLCTSAIQPSLFPAQREIMRTYIVASCLPDDTSVSAEVLGTSQASPFQAGSLLYLRQICCTKR